MAEKRAPFRGALFDMDGLLLDSERACVRAFDKTVQGFGLPPMPEVALACIGLRSDGVRATIAAALAGRVDFSTFYTAWGQRVSTAVAQGIAVKSGALDLLKALQAQGIPCAVSLPKKPCNTRERASAARAQSWPQARRWRAALV